MEIHDGPEEPSNVCLPERELAWHTRILTAGTRGGVVMTEALQAAIAALDETDHTRLPAQMVAEIVLTGAATALRREIEEEMVAPIRAELEAAQHALASR